MKNYIGILVIFLSSFLYAQEDTALTTIKCSKYIKTPELAKFTGTWKWVQGNDSFEIILKKEKVFDIMIEYDSCIDRLIGFHRYIKNGKLIESTLEKKGANFDDKLHSISVLNVVTNDIEIEGSIINISISRLLLHIKFELIDETHLKIKLIENYPGPVPYGPGVPSTLSEINLPQGIILTKQ